MFTVTTGLLGLSLFMVGAASAQTPSTPASAAVAPPAGVATATPTSLQETYDNWVVTCVTRDGKKVCSLIQQQSDKNSGQRIVAAEVTSASPLEGTLLLPFGIAVSQPLALELDGTAFGAPIPFRTCLPSGCLVPLKLDAASLGRLKSGTTLTLKANADGGQPVTFALPLKGFSAGLDRLAVLLKDAK
jgi:invasion protein IalB